MKRKIFYSLVLIANSYFSGAQEQPLADGKVEINREYSFDSITSIDLVNSHRNVVIKSGSEKKIRVQTTFNISTRDVGNLDWLKLLSISITSVKKGSIEVYSQGSLGLTKNWLKGKRDDFKYDSSLLFKIREAQRNGKKEDASLRKELDILRQINAQTITLVISLPPNIVLNVYNAFSDVTVNPYYQSLSALVLNTNLNIESVKNLKLDAQLSTVNVSRCIDAQVEFKNGSLLGGEISNLNMKSAGSSIQYAGGRYAYLQSDGDKIIVDSLQELDIYKNFGFLTVGKLITSLRMTGKNADLKLGHLGSNLKQIVLEDSYADIQIPGSNLSAYFVQFEGQNSTFFAPFEKQEIDQAGKVLKAGSQSLSAARFTAQVGNKENTKINIKCNNCNIRFN
jgi:hypothetical protein